MDGQNTEMKVTMGTDALAFEDETISDVNLSAKADYDAPLFTSYGTLHQLIRGATSTFPDGGTGTQPTP